MARAWALCALLGVWIALGSVCPAFGSLEGVRRTPRDPLEEAAQAGDVERVKELLTQEENPYVRDYALQFAIRGRHREVTELLIAHGARYALKVASEEGDADLVRQLLAKGANAKERDSALFFAAGCGRKETVELLLSDGASVNTVHWNDLTPLSVAVALGCDVDTLTRFRNNPVAPFPGFSANRNDPPPAPVEVFRDTVRLLVSRGADVNATGKQHGFTSLHYAILGGDREIVETLLGHGAVVNPESQSKVRSLYDVTPLHLAVQYGQSAICELLIRRGADVNSKMPPKYGIGLNSPRQTPLYHAVQSGNAEVVRLLIDHGAQVNVVDGYDETPLLRAAEYADPNIVEILLFHGALVDANDDEGRTALHYAAEREDRSIVEVLLSHGADANRKSRDGRTPISIATASGSEEIVRLLTAGRGAVTIHTAASTGDITALERLVQGGFDVNRLDASGQTPLHAAANAGQLPAVQWLVERGATVDSRDDKNQTALSIAIAQAHRAHRNWPPASDAELVEGKHTAVMAFLLGQGGVPNYSLGMPKETVLSHAAEVARLLAERGPDGDIYSDRVATLLHRVAWGGSAKAVGELLALGADVNAVDSRGGTPLHAAVQSGATMYSDVLFGPQMDALRVLLDHGAKVNAGNKWNMTALHGAAQYGHIEAMELLLARGADPNIATNDGSTPLLFLLASHSFDRGQIDARMRDFILSLIRRGVRVDVRNGEGTTVLQQAAALDFPDLLAEILSRGAPVNAGSKTGWTALHSAVAAGREDNVRVLLGHQADPNALGYSPKDVPGVPWHQFEKAGVTPLHIAVARGSHSIVQSLIAAGADMSILDGAGRTPLTLAIEKKDVKAVRFLLDGGADANIPTADGDAAIYRAAAEGRRELVELLLKYGVDGDPEVIKTLLETGTTPLHQAAETGDAAQVKALLDAGAKAEIADRQRFLPIHLANAKGYTEIVRLLVPKASKPVLTRLLFSQIEAGRAELIPLLVAEGVDVNSHDSFRQLTPLHTAVEKGNIEMAKLLIAQGADINAQDESGEIPLGAAVYRQQKDMVALFLSHRVQVNTAYTSRQLAGCIPLHLAMRLQDKEIARMLVLAGSDVNVQGGYDRMSPLHVAMRDRDLFDLMLRHGGKVNNPAGNGTTCLHMAGGAGLDGWVEYLIGKGALVDVQDREGNTPLHLAAKGGHVAACKALLARGADVRIANGKGLLALQYAEASDLTDIIVDLTPKTR